VPGDVECQPDCPNRDFRDAEFAAVDGIWRNERNDIADSITRPKCGMTSHNPNDIREVDRNVSFGLRLLTE
jgi:hypothetical protein